VYRDTVSRALRWHNSLVFNPLSLVRHLHFFLAYADSKSEISGDAMTTRMQNRLAVAAMMAAILAVPTVANSATIPTVANQPTKNQEPASTARREIVVSLEDRKLALLENGKVVKVYSVAVGKPTTPSPVGTFTIERRVVNPTYSHDGRVVAPGPNNPVGSRWMGLNIKGYGIHGTNVPSPIGKAVSHGCIRMGKADIEDLFSRVSVGDQVELIGQRNQETAQLFGDGQNAVPNAHPVQQTTLAAATPAATAPAAVQPANSATSLSTLTRAGFAAVAGLAVAGSL
jgi:lipoprotein-anchoring transpeptidase ErfK/SrfK